MAQWAAKAGDERTLAQGWDALSRGAWEEARARFEAATSATETPEALEGLSWAAWWLSDAQTVFDARERGYRLYRSKNDRRGAARMATWIGTDSVDFRGEVAIANGWLARARHLLDGVEPGPEHGWLDVHEAEKRLHAGDTAGARALGMSAARLGRRLGLVELEMMGLATEGLALVTEGDVERGMQCIDEAAAAALGGEFREIYAICWCCCYVIYACELAGDYERAAQWIKCANEWSARMRVEFVHRTCSAHYAGVLIRGGVYAEAEAELIESARRLAELRPPMVAETAVRLGELRRRQGRLDEAVEIFEETVEHPLALLGLAEFCLERGDPAGAGDRAEQYLRDTPPESRTLRATGLGLLVRARAALGDPDGARTALDELEAIATTAPSEATGAAARYSAGVLASALSDGEPARRAFEDAARLYQRSAAPFEAAQARVELARVLAGLRRPRDSAREARAAAASLRRIGATHEAAKADAVVLEVTARAAGPVSLLTQRERQVLRCVAEGKSDRAIAGDLVLSEHTVHRHMANILTKLGCSSRSAAVAEAVRNGLI